MVFIVAALHFGFLVYLVVGGFVAVRWRRAIWPYLLAVSWAAVTVLLHLNCPMTSLEQWGRRHADMLALPPTGFISHYLTGVLYPADWSAGVELAVFVVVTTSLIAYVASGRRRASGDRPNDGLSRRA
jgi:hypothetical protein